MNLISASLLLLLTLVSDASANYTTQSVVKTTRPSIVSFKSLDRHVLLGLDLVVPFLTMPTGKYKDKDGNDKALINIDTSSLIVTGLITGGSIAVSHLFRSLGILAESKETKEDKEEDNEENKRAGKSADMDILEPFKFVYINSAGKKVETSLNQLYDSLEETFLEKHIDLSACLQKSICTMVYEASVHLKSGKANGMDKIIDGIVNLQWLENMLQHDTLRSAIDAGKSASGGNCHIKYPHCSWSTPHVKLLEILKMYIKFT